MTHETQQKLFSFLNNELGAIPLESEMREIEDIIKADTEPTFLDKLTDLQDKIGYTPGEIHPVAILGLIGESGEVSECCEIIGQIPDDGLFQWSKLKLQENAREIDEIKKKLRRSNESAYVSHSDSIDSELADLFYYLKAVARGRGLSIEDLARMSYEKVIARRGVVNEGDPAK